MNAPLTILVAYGSSQIGARVLHRISGMPNLSIVGQARNANDAIAMITSKKPRLVILDVFLEDGSALDVLRDLRRRSLPIVVMMTSTSKFPQDRRECLKCGADYFFHLPDDIDALSSAVGGLARNVSEKNSGRGGSAARKES